jgi:hypothetical protein
LDALVSRCSKGTQVLDRYFIGIIYYGGDAKNPNCLSYFQGETGDALHPVSEIARTATIVSQTVGDQVVETPVWVEPLAAGQTPMNQGLELAKDTIAEFLAARPNCYPPVVFNITDGKPSDANPLPCAQAIQGLASSGGNVVLFNIHISNQGGTPICFADSEEGLADQYARLLFRMSSPLPPSMLRIAQCEELPISEGARAFAFNADVDSVVNLLEIGTRV